MNRRFAAWSTALIASLVVSGLCLRFLAVQGIPHGENLAARGAACLAFVVLFAAWRRLPLVPKAIGKQTVRALIAGLGLSFYAMTYDWLTASAVALLANIDVPMLVVLGPLVGVHVSTRVRLIALVPIAFLIWYVSALEAQPALVYGLASLSVATLLLCAGYWFIKTSMSEENEAVTILVPSLAIIAYGLAQSGGGAPWTAQLAVVAVISGASMFGAYIASMRLYEQADLAWAEFPTLLAAIVLQPIEAVLLASPMQATYILAAIGFVMAVYIVLVLQKRESAPLLLPPVHQSRDFTCGAACFDSMFRYFRGWSPGELYFARELGTLELGYTPVEHVVQLIERYGFACTLRDQSAIKDVRVALAKRHVVFVTWWDEDAGHYSLVTQLTDDHIVLMDPWPAEAYNRLPLSEFVGNWQRRGGKMISVTETPKRTIIRA